MSATGCVANSPAIIHCYYLGSYPTFINLDSVHCAVHSYRVCTSTQFIHLVSWGNRRVLQDTGKPVLVMKDKIQIILELLSIKNENKPVSSVSTGVSVA